MRKLCLVVLCSLFVFQVLAQQAAKTFYFMDNVPIRLGLNPALQPQKGYFSFPLLGSVGASVVTNGLSVKDFMDMLDDKNGYLKNNKFLDKLDQNNFVNADLALDLISFGFYSGKGFWNFDIGAKLALNTSIPKTMFEFLQNADHLEEEILNGSGNYDVRDLQLHLNAFGQIGLGYSRPVFDWLTVGGKIKFLVGLANLDLEVDELNVRTGREHWTVETRARLEASMKGLNLKENEEGYIDDMDFDSPGIGGYGVGFDFGVQATLLKHLILSAAITDLGFIKWSAGATNSAFSEASYAYSPGEDINVFTEDLYRLEVDDKSKSRRSSLYSTLNVGAEYSFWCNRLGVGLLSSTTFYTPEVYSELTVSANFRPGSWFGASLSYSFLHSDFKTLGFGLRFGPVFLATDYMVMGDFEDISCANAYLGINFPIGGKNKKYKNTEKQKKE